MVSSVTAHSDMAPSPRADIVIDDADVAVGAVTVTVLQLSKSGTVPVRGAIGRDVAGGFAVTDYEIPPGVAVTYRVEQFDVSGASLGFALNMSAQVDIPVGWAVFSDPLVPSNAVLLRAERVFAESLSKSRATQLYRAGGSTVALSGVQSLLQDVTLRCVTGSEPERVMLQAIVDESLVLVRTMPQMRLPGALFVVVPDSVLVPFDARTGGDTDVWDLVGEEITRPLVDVVVPVYTWQDIIDYYPTWADLIADRATWLDVISTPPPSA